VRGADARPAHEADAAEPELGDALPDEVVE